MTVPTPTGRPNKRLFQTVMDMVRSIALVLLAVGVVWILVWRPTKPTERVVDVAGMQQLATSQASFTPEVPGTTTGLTATSVRWEGTDGSKGIPVWHIGYVANGDEYLQISQSTAASGEYLAEQTAKGEPAGESSLGGATWMRYEAPDRRSLVKMDGGVTTIVSGTLAWPALETYAASLVASPSKG